VPWISGQNRTSVEGTRLATTIEFVGFGLRRPGAGVHGARDMSLFPRVSAVRDALSDTG
jgi:hypothetical protein